MKANRKTWLLLFLCLWVVFSCARPPEEPVLYKRLVIDTYKPTDGAQGGTVDTVASLFDAGGEAGPAIAEDDNGNLSYFYAARIDYTDPVGFTSGTVLYVRVQGKLPSTSGAYAIRLVLDSPDPYDSSWFDFDPDENLTDTPYESDDAAPAGIPTNPAILTVGAKLNRFLGAGDIDWFRLVLP
jgi:hypothetical protein